MFQKECCVDGALAPCVAGTWAPAMAWKPLMSSMLWLSTGMIVRWRGGGGGFGTADFDTPCFGGTGGAARGKCRGGAAPLDAIDWAGMSGGAIEEDAGGGRR